MVSAVFVLTYGVRGCRPTAGNDPEDALYVPPGAEGAPTSFSGGRTSEAAFMDVAVVMTGRICHDAFEGTLATDMSSDGASYLVSLPYQRGSRKYQGFKVFNTQGKLLWEHIFTNPNYRSSRIGYLADGRFIGALAVTYGEDGEFHLFDSGGRSLLERPVRGWTEPVLSEDGSWLALFDRRRRLLEVFGGPTFKPTWSAACRPGGGGFFLGDGPEFLFYEAGTARLLDATGKALWTVSIPESSRWNVALSPDRRYLAATTQDPDSTIYLYSMSDGALKWSQFLVAGGKKRITFSPDGSSIMIYDVGRYGDVYALNTATGEIAWRFRLQGREDSIITFENLVFTPSGQHMVADVVESTRTEDAYLFYHYLLLMTPDGRALWVSPLGAEVDVDLAAATGVALVTTNYTYEQGGSITNSVTLVSFVTETQTDPGTTGGSGGGG
jgi:outer membrane protein assembly factor BamB